MEKSYSDKNNRNDKRYTNDNRYRILQVIKYLVCLIGIPTVVVGGTIAFDGKQYAFLSIVVIVLAAVPFIISFEKRNVSTERLVILSVLVALSVFGRFCFSPLPHFKPVTAVVIITGMYMGMEMGFMCGALSAVLSNFMFGQGPWTPFQMFAWGIIGFLSGVFAKMLKKNMIALLVYGALCGIIYSLFMDIWTTMWQDGYFNLSRYMAYVTFAIPTIVVYMVSNVVFLLVLARPIGKKLERVLVKI